MNKHRLSREPAFGKEGGCVMNLSAGIEKARREFMAELVTVTSPGTSIELGPETLTWGKGDVTYERDALNANNQYVRPILTFKRTWIPADDL